MTEAQPAYFKINFDQFRIGESIPCAIYTDNGKSKDVLVDKDMTLSEPLYASLIDAADLLYVKQEDREKIFSYMSQSLQTILDDAAIDPHTKSKKLHGIATQSLQAFFDNPVEENALQAQEAINATTDLIVQSDEARDTLFTLAGHDYYTYTHSCNVGIFGVGLAKALMGGKSSFRAHRLGMAFFFHDIGKVRVDSKIIQKPAKLDRDEFDEMKHHPAYGVSLLEQFNLLTTEARCVVMQHHERLDGSGYPQGLVGPQIHPFARICSVVDVFDALTSVRSYRDRNSPYEACQIMLRDLNTFFDPRILSTFIRLIEASEK